MIQKHANACRRQSFTAISPAAKGGGGVTHKISDIVFFSLDYSSFVVYIMRSGVV